MRVGDGRTQPAAEHSASKRRDRDASLLQPCHHLHETSNKRRLLAETETLALEPLSTYTPTLPTNYAPSSHSSLHTHKKHKNHHLRKTSTADADRNWVYSTRDLSLHKDKIVLVSYNILAVENASKHPNLYSRVPPKYLDWDHRKKLLCEEISRYSASILCFQEVDRFCDLDNLLQKDGFRGVYQARTGEACDGCAIFWKNELFTLLHQESIEFQMFGLRNNVAQLCVLKMIQDQPSSIQDTKASLAFQSRRLLVGNIHVLFNPKRGDIKLGQIRLFLKKAHELSQEWGNIPVVLAGDFNSMPQSAMYQFLASAELDLQLHDRRNISGPICPLEYQPYRRRYNYAASFWSSVSRPPIYRWSCEELSLATGNEGVTQLRHPLKLCSAYRGVHKIHCRVNSQGCGITRDNHGEPLATSYHSNFMGTVDYIWHTREVVPVRVLDTLPINILRQMGGLPSKKWGSDHLALVCELAFAEDVNEI